MKKIPMILLLTLAIAPIILFSIAQVSHGEDIEDAFYFQEKPDVPQRDSIGETDAMKDPRESEEGKNTDSNLEEEFSIRDGVANVASAVESATNLGSSTCGFSPGAGVAAIPCLAAQIINFLTSGIGFIFGR